LGQNYYITDVTHNRKSFHKTLSPNDLNPKQIQMNKIQMLKLLNFTFFCVFGVFVVDTKKPVWLIYF